MYARPYIALLRYVLRIWTSDDEKNVDKLWQGYRALNAHIRIFVPKKRLLFYHVSQGCESLCKFLGRPIPTTPMPRVNEAMFVAELHEFLWEIDLLQGLTRWGKTLLPVGVVDMACLVYRRYYSQIVRLDATKTPRG